MVQSLSGAVVTITDKEKVDLARKSIRENIEKGIQISTEKTKLNLSFSDEYILDSNIKTVDQSIEVVRKRVDESGTKEPVIQKQGEKRIIVQLPGIKDPERIRSLIGRTAKLNFHLLDPTTVELAQQRGKLPPGTFRVSNADPTAYEKEFLVKKRILLTGDNLVNAAATVDAQSGKYVVAFEFDRKGGKNLQKLRQKMSTKD